MSRRGKIRLISFGSALMLVLMVAVAACHVGAGAYTIRLDAQSARAFGEACSAADRLRRSLDACAYAADAPMQNTLCTQLYADAAAAETALSMLPVELDALENVSREIAVAGDYARVLSHAAAEGNAVSLSALSEFSEPIRTLCETLSEMQEAFSKGELISESRRMLTDAFDNLQDETEDTDRTFDLVFHELAASFPAVKPLVYDGQYSDRSEDFSSLLKGRAIVSQSEAKEIAAAFLQKDASLCRPLGLRFGEIPCWLFSEPIDHSVISVTVRGGEVLQMLSDCAERGDADLEQAKATASVFLEDHGYTDMVCVAAETAGSEVLLAYSLRSDDILCLPDQVALRVCPTTGKITAFDASEYIRHHVSRTILNTEMVWTPPEGLQVESQSKVVLLSPGGREHCCVEYLCRTPEGEAVCIDVNADTGRQERILVGESQTETID